ncbi:MULTISPECIES: pseudouridine synthase [Aphanothece]|uniref:pseudouridine synthase n=1 Tax=Aphanothece stagnina TaxID=1004305 RepID=UPI003984E3C2
MTTLLFHKPYGVLSQFTPEPGSRWQCLAPFIDVPGVYAAGRLDADSEGLLVLTDHGPLQQRLTDPAFGHWRRYWVQVEGESDQQPEALERLRRGVIIQGQPTRPARISPMEAPDLPDRIPPVRHRRSIPTSWLQVELQEGRNRQVRRMTAAVGLPTLRLLRVAIDLMDGEPPLTLAGLEPGQWRPASEPEERRLAGLLRRTKRAGRVPGALSPGRGGRAGGGKSGQAGGGG